MKRSSSLAIIFSVLFWFEGLSFAGQRHVAGTHIVSAHRSVSRARVAPGGFKHRHGRPVAPYNYRRHYHHRPNYPPVVVISPYSHYFYVPPPVVVTTPFFCVLHNHGFVSRVGLLDHLSGMHRISLHDAASLCPDGVENCIFPSY
ncbi:MAG: hypothetical protein ACREQ2_19910 [Candidatus Binatia bacterium]